MGSSIGPQIFTVPAPLVTRSQGSAESRESLNQWVGEASNGTCSVHVHHPTASTTAATAVTNISSSASKRFVWKLRQAFYTSGFLQQAEMLLHHKTCQTQQDYADPAQARPLAELTFRVSETVTSSFWCFYWFFADFDLILLFFSFLFPLLLFFHVSSKLSSCMINFRCSQVVHLNFLRQCRSCEITTYQSQSPSLELLLLPQDQTNI